MVMQMDRGITESEVTGESNGENGQFRQVSKWKWNAKPFTVI